MSYLIPPNGVGIIGEAHYDDGGFLHGWCWNSAMPEARLQVELLMRDAVIRRLVASRFREDLRERGVGDGYHGFSVALPPEVWASHEGVYASAQVAGTAKIFWQVNAHNFDGDEDLNTALQQAGSRLRSCAGTLGQLKRESRTDCVAWGLKELAARLHMAAGRNV
jgi:hypothetical protein